MHSVPFAAPSRRRPQPVPTRDPHARRLSRREATTLANARASNTSRQRLVDELGPQLSDGKHWLRLSDRERDRGESCVLCGGRSPRVHVCTRLLLLCLYLAPLSLFAGTDVLLAAHAARRGIEKLQPTKGPTSAGSTSGGSALAPAAADSGPTPMDTWEDGFDTDGDVAMFLGADVTRSAPDAPLSQSALRHVAQEPGSQEALDGLLSNDLPPVSPLPPKPHDPRSVGAGLRAARAARDHQIRAARVTRRAGRLTDAERDAADAVGAPRAKYGSVRWRAHHEPGLRKSAIGQIDRKRTPTLLTPEQRGGHNAVTSHHARGMLKLWFRDREERSVNTQAVDIDNARMLFETVVMQLHDRDRNGSDAEADRLSDSQSESEVDLTAAANSRDAASESDSPASALASAAEAAAASVARARRARHREAVLAVRRKRRGERATRPLSQASLSRLCASLGWSRQKSQAKKPSRVRESREQELRHFQSVAQLWPRDMLFVTDETQVRHKAPPQSSYATKGAGGAHTLGEDRGPSSTVLFCASGYVQRCFVGYRAWACAPILHVRVCVRASVQHRPRADRALRSLAREAAGNRDVFPLSTSRREYAVRLRDQARARRAQGSRRLCVRGLGHAAATWCRAGARPAAGARRQVGGLDPLPHRRHAAVHLLWCVSVGLFAPVASLRRSIATLIHTVDFVSARRHG